MDATIKDSVKIIKFVYIGMLFGTVLFFCLVLFLSQKIQPFLKDHPQSFFILAIANVVALTSLVAGMLIFKARLKTIGAFDLEGKLLKYKEAIIIRTASMEGACFILLLVFLVLGNKMLLYEAAIVFALMLVFFPSKYRMVSEMGIDYGQLD